MIDLNLVSAIVCTKIGVVKLDKSSIERKSKNENTHNVNSKIKIKIILIIVHNACLLTSESILLHDS